MDRGQAKEILMLFRPGTTDAAEPRMAEALEMARRDPELAVWFEQHCAVYLSIRGKLKAIPVPPDLQRRIVVERAERTRILRRPGTVRLLLAAAALVALTTMVWKFFSVPSESDFSHFRLRMAGMVQRASYIQFSSTNQAEINAFFATNNAPTNFELPRTLAQLPGEGGGVFTFENNPVVMLCLNGGLNSAGRTNDVWVFVINKAALPDPPPAGTTNFVKITNLMTAGWTAGEKVYLLAGAGKEADLEKYLQ